MACVAVRDFAIIFDFAGFGAGGFGTGNLFPFVRLLFADDFAADGAFRPVFIVVPFEFAADMAKGVQLLVFDYSAAFVADVNLPAFFGAGGGNIFAGILVISPVMVA